MKTDAKKTDNRGTCKKCEKKGKRLDAAGLCTNCRPAASAPQEEGGESESTPAVTRRGKVLELDGGSETIDVSGAKVRGFTYPFDPKKTVYTLTFPAGVSAHKAITPATFKLPKGAQLVVRRSYELVIDGKVVRGLGALVDDGTVGVEIHEDERQTPAARRKASEPQAEEGAAAE